MPDGRVLTLGEQCAIQKNCGRAQTSFSKPKKLRRRLLDRAFWQPAAAQAQ